MKRRRNRIGARESDDGNSFKKTCAAICISIIMGVIYTGDAGDMSPLLFVMDNFVVITF